MIPWISQELHQQLLDRQNNRRAYALEKLKLVLCEVDVKSVPCVEEFLNVLSGLIEETNFGVKFGALKVLHLLIQKLNMASLKYFEHIVTVAVKIFGDTRNMTKNESLKLFGQLMKAVPPQRVVDQVVGNLKNENSRVREDVLNVIMVAMLSHREIDFNIPKLSAKVAPYLVDSTRKVRHSSFELFALFYHCLGSGIKQGLISAVKMVELTEDAGGLMAAVDARQARNALPKLSTDGILEYGLVLLIPRQRSSADSEADADLDWVMDGPQVCSIMAAPEEELPPRNTPDGACSQQQVKRRTSKPRRTKSLHPEQLHDQLPEVQNRGREKIRQSVQNTVPYSPGEDERSTINEELYANSNSLSDEATPRPTIPIKCDTPTPPHQPSPPTVSPDQQEMAPRQRKKLSRMNLPSPPPGQFEVARSPSQSSERSNFPKPNMATTLDLISSPEWVMKIEGLTNASLLVKHNPNVIQDRLHELWRAVITEVKNNRSAVERAALCTLGDMFTCLQEAMDSTLDESVEQLLKKVQGNIFIQQDADKALDCMIQHCTASSCLHALLAGGLNDRCKEVRGCMARHLTDLVVKLGAARILSGAKDITEKLLPALSQLAQDAAPEARAFGRQMLLLLSQEPKFYKVLGKYINAKDLETIRKIANKLRTKVVDDERPQRGRGTQSGPSRYNSRSQTQSFADKGNYVKQLSLLMASKDFKERMQGIDQIVDDSKNNPDVIISSIHRVFDAIRERLTEYNSKVNLHALMALPEVIVALEDNLSQVVNTLVPAIVDNHLNSKKEPIYCAAIGAIDALITHLDNTHLLQIFCNKAMFLNGKAKTALIEKVTAIVTNIFHQKPKVVKQKVLPVLWHLLGLSIHSSSLHSLCRALYQEMGSELSECAASQPLTVRNSLTKILSSLR